MRKFIITMLMCAGMVLTMSAVQPLDVQASRQDGSVAEATAPVGEAVGVSLVQFMRQHGVTLGDNRMAKRLQLNSAGELVGNRIALMYVYDVNPDDGSVAETPVDKIWMAQLITGDSDDQVKVEDFCSFDIYAAAESAEHFEEIFFDDDSIISVDLPIQVDIANGAALLRSDEPIYHSEAIVVDPGNDKYKHKKTTDIFIVPLDGLSPGDQVTGCLYDDGSILIEGGFMLTTRLIYKSWRGSIVEQENYDYEIDTVFVNSPVYRDLYLLTPNGIHEYKKKNRLEFSEGRLVTKRDYLKNLVSFGISGEPLGFGGKKPVKPGNGSSGGWNSVISPGNSGSLFSSNPGNDSELSLNLTITTSTFTGLTEKITRRLINPFVTGVVCDPSGFGGKKPVKPGQGSGDTMGFDFPGNSGLNLFSSGLPSNDGLSLNVARGGSDRGPVTVEQPVYMYQIDDTIYVCNLYGNLMIDNYMVVHDDGTMSFPAQVIGNLVVTSLGVSTSYPLYNYSAPRVGASWNDMTPGCSGNVTADGITWGITALYCENTLLRMRINYCYIDNKLYFTGGNEGVNISTVTRKINEVMNGKASITDVTTLINRSINQR